MSRVYKPTSAPVLKKIEFETVEISVYLSTECHRRAEGNELLGLWYCAAERCQGRGRKRNVCFAGLSSWWPYGGCHKCSMSLRLRGVYLVGRRHFYLCYNKYLYAEERGQGVSQQQSKGGVESNRLYNNIQFVFMVKMKPLKWIEYIYGSVYRHTPFEWQHFPQGLSTQPPVTRNTPSPPSE